ncbi:MAG: DNA replication and repair protein RecF, partial [Alistipes sp.]|nr:DNA replication and repair protein RecF [Alistipes sp.]
MRLNRLSLLNFKNIAREEIILGDGINCFVGDNGAGKTNIIDALYYLSMCKSLLQVADSLNIKHGEEYFMLDGTFLTDKGKSESVVCSFSRKSGKLFKRNAKEYERLADHVGLIPTVIVSPSDSTLISDSAEERRRYLNGFISQLNRGYLSSVMRYNAILAERNKFLKISIDEDMLLIYDKQLSEHAHTIHELRKSYIERLQPLVAHYYKFLSEDREQVDMSYRSELNDAAMADILLRNRERDFVNQFTTQGVHRDDMVLKIGGYPLRKYGSQGQQKS